MTDTRWTKTQCHDEGHRIFVTVKKSSDYEVTAGKLLIEAQERIKGVMTFQKFLTTCCTEKGHAPLKKSRAYDLIRIAGGKTTIEAVRFRSNLSSQKTRKRQRESDAAVKASAASGHATSPPSPSPTSDLSQAKADFIAQHGPSSQANLAELVYVFDVRWPRLNAADRAKFTDHVLAASNVRAAA
jgi:hypothetical protein